MNLPSNLIRSVPLSPLQLAGTPSPGMNPVTQWAADAHASAPLAAHGMQAHGSFQDAVSGPLGTLHALSSGGAGEVPAGSTEPLTRL